MSALLFKVLSFIGENAQLFEALIDVIESGASKESILKSIRAAEVKASDELMKQELTK